MSTSHHPSPDLIPEEMRNALAKFGEEAEQILTSFAISLESYQPRPIIYHYTDDVGLRGILESGRLWLTDIFSLNDPSELKHGLSLAVRILNEKAANGPEESKLFARDFGSLNEAIRRSAHYFVCSLSERGDDLGQWRAYADNGRGYALGFDAKALEDAFAKNGKTPTSDRAVFPVTYQDATLGDIHRRIIEKMFDLISLPRGKKLHPDAIMQYVLQLSVSLAAHALHGGLFFKHEAYSNEKEYSFLEIHRADVVPDVKLRSRPYSLVRYREFDWKGTATTTPLKKIVFGPAANQEAALRFAEDCLRQFVLGKVEVIASAIPYRTL